MTSLSSYVFRWQGTQHVTHVGPGRHVHEWWWDRKGWHHNDLTLAAQAPLPAVRSALSGYAIESQNTQHVYYMSTDQHVHELRWESKVWHHTKLKEAVAE